MGFVFNYQEHAERRAKEDALAAQAFENTKIQVPQTVLPPLQKAVGDLPSVHIKQHESQFIPINAGTMTNWANLEQRPFIMDGCLLRGYITQFVAPGGVGKSIIALLIAISVAIGRDLCNLGLKCRAKVLLINNEDDMDEIQRRLVAICIYYEISQEEIDDWLYVYSGYNKKILIAREDNGEVNKSDDYKDLEQFVRNNQIELAVLDPFVSTHNANENDNNKMDMVVSVYKELAGIYKLAVLIIHHTHKMGGSSFSGNAEAGRGASAVKDACRISYTLCRMDSSVAEEYNISIDDQLRLVGLQDAKRNFSLPTGEQIWFYMETVKIPNGDFVGVPRRYKLGEPVSKPKKSPDQIKLDNANMIASVVLGKLGIGGGTISASKLTEAYRLKTGLGRSTAYENFGLLPSGCIKAHIIIMDSKSYRIYQTKEDKAKAPIMIHVEAQD